MHFCFRTLSLVSLLIVSAGSLFAGVPQADWFPKAPALAAPKGEVIDVASVEQLQKAIAEVPAGGTIQIADGHYFLPRYVEIRADNVTLRSKSGERDRVILDGLKSRHGELIGIADCQGVTIADLTVQNVKWNGIKINSDRGAQRVTVRNCVLHNIWQRGIKAPGLRENAETNSPRDCRIEYCLFYNDRPKQFADDETDTEKSFNGNYIGGIDVKNTINWRITDNVFLGIQGRTREGRGCIYISEDGRGCLIERNAFLNCDIGIALGNPSQEIAKHHAVNCTARDNLIVDCPETGILACYTQDCVIQNNTVHDPQSRLRRLIWVQNANDGLQVTDNLLIGSDVQVTSDSDVAVKRNVAIDSLASDESKNVGQTTLPADAVAQAIELPQKLKEAEAQSAEARLAPGVLSEDVVAAMRKVHADFDGQDGYVAQFGDSITYSMAFWSPIGWDAPEKYIDIDDGLPKAPKNVPWRDYVKGTRDKGPKFANYSGWKVGQLNRSIDAVLASEKPEVAIIMIGTNDIAGGKVPDSYRAALEEVIEKCLAAHCVPIVNTIPPRRNRDEAVGQINQIIREVANQAKVPLADFHAECVRLRPDGSWDGTVISKDGVHPSGGKSNVYTDENLKNCGYALRNWVNFLVLRQVYFRVLNSDE